MPFLTAGRSLNGLFLELAALNKTKTLLGADFTVAAKIMQATIPHISPSF